MSELMVNLITISDFSTKALELLENTRSRIPIKLKKTTESNYIGDTLPEADPQQLLIEKKA